jgi:hypothetical protein
MLTMVPTIITSKFYQSRYDEVCLLEYIRDISIIGRLGLYPDPTISVVACPTRHVPLYIPAQASMQYNQSIILHGITRLGLDPRPQTLIFRCSPRPYSSSTTGRLPTTRILRPPLNGPLACLRGGHP